MRLRLIFQVFPVRQPGLAMAVRPAIGNREMSLEQAHSTPEQMRANAHKLVDEIVDVYLAQLQQAPKKGLLEKLTGFMGFGEPQA